MTAELTTKELLTQNYQIDLRIKAKIAQVQAMRALSTNATTVLSGMPKAATPETHGMEKVIATIVDLENEITQDMETLVELRQEITSLIRRVTKPEVQTVLELRYLACRPWSDIAAMMGYERRQVYRFHTRGIEEVDRLRQGS